MSPAVAARPMSAVKSSAQVSETALGLRYGDLVFWGNVQVVERPLRRCGVALRTARGDAAAEQLHGAACELCDEIAAAWCGDIPASLPDNGVVLTTPEEVERFIVGIFGARLLGMQFDPIPDPVASADVELEMMHEVARRLAVFVPAEDQAAFAETVAAHKQKLIELASTSKPPKDDPRIFVLPRRDSQRLTVAATTSALRTLHATAVRERRARRPLPRAIVQHHPPVTRRRRQRNGCRRARAPGRRCSGGSDPPDGPPLLGGGP
jgi:hypothetical protein